MPRSTRLANDGRITIPKFVREKLDLQPGDRIEWIVEGDTVRFSRQLRLREVMGMFKLPEGMTFEKMMERADEGKGAFYSAMYLEECR